ncbi:rhamnogalacturonan acetylesterase [candidate division KSB1 bacterium]|nr:rhamnogalacturonan acetylesterase [candidate division KSB1 bacterium]
MKRFTILFLFIVLIFRCQTTPVVDVYLIGDSTMANKPLEGNPERGWGQMLPEFFKENVRIHNHARNGRSTKSFINEGRWQIVLDSLKSGDYVMIQFGHNDQKDYDTTRYAAPHGAYKNNLRQFVDDTRNKGAIPILLTPVMRRKFNDNDQFYDTHGDYPDVVCEVAKEMNVPLIDLHQSSRELLVALGPERSKEIFLWVDPGKYDRLPDGKQDDTHFNEHGAREIARLVAKGLQSTGVKLKRYLKNGQK